MSLLLTGPVTGQRNQVLEFKVSSSIAINQPVNVTVNVSGGGTLSANVVQLTPSAPEQTFTYTPTTISPKVFTLSNNQQLSNPPAFNLTIVSSLSDRFLLLYPSLPVDELDSLSDAELITTYPALHEMVEMVRRYSVFLKKTQLSTIYSGITQHADARIGLVLLAARDSKAIQLFPSLEVVNELMFKVTTSKVSLSSVSFESRAIFHDGIRRVSSALTASLILARLAQVPEQAEHANVLEKQALDDLDRILKIPELTAANNIVEGSTGKEESVGFYFSNWNSSNTYANPTCKIFLSGQWIPIDSYQSTSHLISLIAQVINSRANLTSNSFSRAVVGAPKMNIIAGTHLLELRARNRDSVLAAEPITIEFSGETPFTWGTSLTSLSLLPVNGVIVNVTKGTATSIGNSASTQTQDLTTLYIKTKVPLGDPYNAITYRTTANDTLQSSKIELLLHDFSWDARQRAYDIARALHDSLYSRKEEQSVVGVIHSDYIDETDSLPVVVLELVACVESATEDACIVFDLLSIPEDITVAVGNTRQIIVPFGDAPRSLVLVNQTPSSSGLGGGDPETVTLPPSKLVAKLNKIKEVEHRIFLNDYRHRFADAEEYPWPT